MVDNIVKQEPVVLELGSSTPEQRKSDTRKYVEQQFADVRKEIKNKFKVQMFALILGFAGCILCGYAIGQKEIPNFVSAFIGIISVFLGVVSGRITENKAFDIIQEKAIQLTQRGSIK